MTGELRALEELLKNEIGLDPTSVGPQLILRAVEQRMRDLKLDDLAAYEREVRQSATELQELIEEVVVAESWFFRDERPFEWLRELRSAAAGSRSRALSVANPQPALCGGRRAVFDCNRALGRRAFSSRDTTLTRSTSAPAGWQLPVEESTHRMHSAARMLPYRSRYFREHPEGYEIDPALRTTVQFIQGSILDPRLLEDSPPYDVVFCRNLLIYLIPSARAALLALIDRVLAPDGVLLIGHADRLDSTGAGRGFAPTGDPGCFAYRRISVRRSLRAGGLTFA